MRLHAVEQLLDGSHLLYETRQFADAALTVLRPRVVQLFASHNRSTQTLHLEGFLLQVAGNDGNVVVRDLAEHHVVAVHGDGDGRSLLLPHNRAVDCDGARIDSDKLEFTPNSNSYFMDEGLVC